MTFVFIYFTNKAIYNIPRLLFGSKLVLQIILCWVKTHKILICTLCYVISDGYKVIWCVWKVICVVVSVICLLKFWSAWPKYNKTRISFKFLLVISHRKMVTLLVVRNSVILFIIPKLLQSKTNIVSSSLFWQKCDLTEVFCGRLDQEVDFFKKIRFQHPLFVFLFAQLLGSEHPSIAPHE